MKLKTGQRKLGGELFTSLANSSPIGIYVVQKGKFQFVNEQFQRQTGYSQDGLLGTDSLDLVFPEDREAVKGNAISMLKGLRFQPYEYRIICKDGEVKWIMETVASIRYQGSRATIGNFMDITARKQAEEMLRVEHAFRVAIEDSMLAGVAAVDLQGKQIYVNSAFCEMVGWSKKELIGATPPFVYWPPEDSETNAEALRQVIGGNAKPGGVELRLRRCTEDSFDALEMFSPLVDSHGVTMGWLASIYDITQRKLNEKRLAYLAANDALTGLVNRRSLEEALESAIFRARLGSPSVLLFLDVDHFKLVNDTLGHAAGDEALVKLGQLLQDHVRTGDVAARIGGDEFAILLEGTNMESARSVAKRIGSAMEAFDLPPAVRDCRLSFSIGLTPIDGLHDAAVVLSLADTAMYSAKERGGNQIAEEKMPYDVTMP